MNGKSLLVVVATILVLAIASGVAISAQDKYAVKLPGRVAFS
ncbi:MAG: cytochrome P460, partial [Gammaproteobacteria bacterium]|nr:cytochrome P460 [Gammaproteobacteria bacterium]